MSNSIDDILGELDGKPSVKVESPALEERGEVVVIKKPKKSAKSETPAPETTVPAVQAPLPAVMTQPVLDISAQQWLGMREQEINNILKSLTQVKTFVVGDPTANLGKMHTIASGIREYQAYVGTYMASVFGMELEAKRMLSTVTMKYKDAMGDALDTYKEQIANARSLEEREMRLRKFLPVIREKEEWEQTLESIKLLKEAVQMVYDDLSKAAMTLVTQVNVIKHQILIGELRIVDKQLLQVLQESTVEAVEKASVRAIPNGSAVQL
jgi:hypothetical protein